MAPNKKLGKGLSSLLGKKTDLNFDQKNENGLLLIPIENIFRDENQPRKEFDKEKIDELAQSINKNGLIQPLILTKKDDNSYTLVAGERRWRAAQRISATSITCKIGATSGTLRQTTTTTKVPCSNSTGCCLLGSCCGICGSSVRFSSVSTLIGGPANVSEAA